MAEFIAVTGYDRKYAIRICAVSSRRLLRSDARERPTTAVKSKKRWPARGWRPMGFAPSAWREPDVTGARFGWRCAAREVIDEVLAERGFA